MTLDLPRLSLVLVATALVAACGGNAPSPASVTAGEMKGKFGVFYYVSVSRPVGGTIRSTDGKINCGTAGGPNNLCTPAVYNWTETASLTAIPDTTDLYFQSWAGDCSGAIPNGCTLDTDTFGADKWVAAVFNPADRLGHTSIPSPGQHSPLFFSFIKSLDTKIPGTPRCNTCHGLNYDGLANAPSCTACHAQAGHGNWLTDCAFCHGNPPLPSHDGRSSNCSQCHPDTVLASGAINTATGKHMNGKPDAKECGTCHALPPASGSHLAHWSVSDPTLVSGYGDVTARQDHTLSSGATDGYAFGCGNCHPLDSSKHHDGIMQVEVHDLAAPAGSIKALNPVGAAYAFGTNNDGTCANVYCHSRMDYTAPTVPEPKVQTGPIIVYPLEYDPYVITATRAYASPRWGSAPIGCDGCHGLPTRTTSPTNAAGAGDSHFWVDSWGYGNLHAWSMGYEPIACATCHFDTVTVQGGRRFVGSMSMPEYDPVPVSGFAAHVNGGKDVRFTDENILMGGDTWFTASVPVGTPAPLWNGGAKTCSSVSCHLNQTVVTWGMPYRWENSYECNSCHRY